MQEPGNEARGGTSLGSELRLYCTLINRNIKCTSDETMNSGFAR